MVEQYRAAVAVIARKGNAQPPLPDNVAMTAKGQAIYEKRITFSL